MLNIGFLGGGNMARAIVAGLVSSGADPKLVTVMDRHPEKFGRVARAVRHHDARETRRLDHGA